MATLVFSLSTKVDKVSGLSEILTRFFVGSRINQRAKSNSLQRLKRNASSLTI